MREGKDRDECIQYQKLELSSFGGGGGGGWNNTCNTHRGHVHWQQEDDDKTQEPNQ